MSEFGVFIALLVLDAILLARRFKPLLRAALVSWLLGLSAFALACAIQIKTYRSPNLKTVLSLGILQTLMLAVLALLEKRIRLSRFALWSALFSLPLFTFPMFTAISWNPLSEISWNGWGFLDKRWLFSLYVVVICAVLLIPAIVSKVLRGPEAEGSSNKISSDVRRWTTLVGAVALAWWCWGPPWRIADLVRQLELHELVLLGGIQAIHLGHIPYSHAQVQYGPGLQLLSYVYMKLTSFDLLHLRESAALFNLMAAGIVFSIFALMLRRSFAFGAALFSITSASPLAMYQIQSDRILDGGFGSMNAWRYLGVFLLVTLFHLGAWRIVARRRRIASAALVGVIWGIFTWVSQENLAAGVTAFGIYVILLACTGPLSLKELAAMSGAILAGFVVPWLVVIGYYGSHGSAALFFQHYFMASTLVARGYSNTPFTGNYWKVSYYVTPYLVWIAALVAMFRRGEQKWFRSVNEDESAVLAAAAVVLGSYQNSLFRADDGHYILTTLGLPLLVFASLQILPGKLGLEGRARTARMFRWAAFLLLTLLFPIRIPDALNPLKLPGMVTGLRGSAPVPPLNASLGPAASRIGTRISLDHSCCYANGGTYRAFIELMKTLHDFCGNRPTIVDSFVDFNGYVYFFADLNPALRYTENHHFLFNSLEINKYERLLQGTDYRCVIGIDPVAPAFRYLREKNANTEETTFFFDGKAVNAVRALPELN